jgi:hypothetical protein
LFNRRDVPLHELKTGSGTQQLKRFQGTGAKWRATEQLDSAKARLRATIKKGHDGDLWLTRG